MNYETESHIVIPRVTHSREAKPTFCCVEQIVYVLLSNMVRTQSVAHSFIHVGAKYEEKMNEVRRTQRKYSSVLSRVLTVGLILKQLLQSERKDMSRGSRGYLGSIFLTAIL